MFALIYDTHELDKPFKKVLSLHKSREAAERALEKRMTRLGKKVWECDTRIVWLKEKVNPGDGVTSQAFSTWRPGEKIPYGEHHPDCD
jgi:hypothetical protein